MPTLQEKEPAAKRKRIWLLTLSKNPDTRSIQIGLIWTVLVHLLILLLAPQLLRSEFSGGQLGRAAPSKPTYEVDLAPEAFLSKPAPSIGRFVETNPDANNKIPNNSTNFGAQNQQAAQPVPDKDSKLNMPKTEGRKDFANDSQVISGRLEKPMPSTPTPPAQKEQTAEKKDQTQRKEQVPLSGFIKNQGDNAEGYGTNASSVPAPSTEADKYVAGDVNATTTDGAGVKAAQTTHQKPLPRPKLTQVRPAILKDRPIGVANGGVIGVDAHFSEFGDYLQELIDIVQIEWDRILDSGGTRPKQGSHVLVSFRLNSKGEIAEIVKVDGDAGDYGTNASLSAIQDRAPYRPWTKEMVAVLGDSQVITFDFYYE
jgi:hypothetical protein